MSNRARPSPTSVRKIAFVSPHCVVDFSNGAAVATRDGLQLLASQGFECQAFCGTRFDAREEALVEEILAQQRVAYEVRNAIVGPYRARMIFTLQGKVPVTLFNTASTRGAWLSVGEAAAFLTACEIFLRRNRPDLIWTYGGDPVSLAIHRLAKGLGIPILFVLHNFAYQSLEPFRLVDCVAVPSEFSRRYYREKLGLDCRVLPNVVNWHSVKVERRTPRYVTFINPVPDKGVYVFARIARELAARRPDIPLLVTQGRSGRNALNAPELGSMPPNVTTMPFTPDPRAFYPAVYSATKLLLMPSLWNEAFGLVAAEAMLNGIPVLASNRGALPETVGGGAGPHPSPLPEGEGSGGGFLFDIPAKYTPETREVPSADEVAPWVETIIRLWDDAEFYRRAREAARARAEQWRPERLAPVYREFFSSLAPQRGAPLVPEDVS